MTESDVRAAGEVCAVAIVCHRKDLSAWLTTTINHGVASSAVETGAEIEVLSITRTGFRGLARASTMIHGRVDLALRGLGEVPAVGDVRDLLPVSARRKGRLDELLECFPDSEPALVRVLSAYAATGRSVFLGNSLPIREWNLAAQTSVPLEKVRGIGNAAGTGALAALLSVGERRRAEELAQQAEHIELMARTDFQMVYADSMIFPDSTES